MKGAIFLMFTAFGLFIASGLVFILKQIWKMVKQYFSVESHENRRILFTQNKTTNDEKLFYFKRLQLRYFAERQQQQILKQHQRKEIDALFKAIERDLQRVKPLISKKEVSQFRRKNRFYRAQQNEQALLELLNKIATITSR